MTSIRNLPLAVRLGGASTQQIAASAQELAATADRLNSIVGRFTLAV